MKTRPVDPVESIVVPEVRTILTFCKVGLVAEATEIASVGVPVIRKSEIKKSVVLSALTIVIAAVVVKMVPCPLPCRETGYPVGIVNPVTSV